MRRRLPGPCGSVWRHRCGRCQPLLAEDYQVPVRRSGRSDSIRPGMPGQGQMATVKTRRAPIHRGRECNDSLPPVALEFLGEVQVRYRGRQRSLAGAGHKIPVGVLAVAVRSPIGWNPDGVRQRGQVSHFNKMPVLDGSLRLEGALPGALGRRKEGFRCWRALEEHPEGMTTNARTSPENSVADLLFASHGVGTIDLKTRGMPRPQKDSLIPGSADS
jgi:hypothetical protein